MVSLKKINLFFFLLASTFLLHEEAMGNSLEKVKNSVRVKLEDIGILKKKSLFTAKRVGAQLMAITLVASTNAFLVWFLLLEKNPNNIRDVYASYKKSCLMTLSILFTFCAFYTYLLTEKKLTIYGVRRFGSKSWWLRKTVSGVTSLLLSGVWSLFFRLSLEKKPINSIKSIIFTLLLGGLFQGFAGYLVYEATDRFLLE